MKDITPKFPIIQAEEEIFFETTQLSDFFGEQPVNVPLKPKDLTVREFLKKSVQSGVTAYAGGGQANGVLITSDIVEISTCATAQDSVKLPVAVVGMEIKIVNHGAQSCDVFPNTSDKINEGAVNVAKALAADASMICVCWDVDNWECLTLAR